ncbi:MAG TPA: AsmA family protein, partial [Xanthobacteraceae bacterium]|nr:AsmA family protein [Xanthobacteraceae bacterium]
MSALSRMQRMAVAVFATVAVVTALLFVLPYFLVSEQKVRAEVARSIFAATGVSPRIEGEVKLTLLPRPAILLSDVQFEDGTTNGLTIESLQATVQFLPLLYGDVKIATLTLSRPRLIVEFSADGKLVGGLPMNSPMKVDDDAPELRIVDGSILLRIQG